MAVRRIVANIAPPDPEAALSFYGGILGLDVAMDHGWIVTYASSPVMAAPQISIASEGGSGTAVPDLSVKVDDLEDVLVRVRSAGLAIEYGPCDEPWGVRRFYIRDPFGRLVNILAHASDFAPEC